MAGRRFCGSMEALGVAFAVVVNPVPALIAHRRHYIHELTVWQEAATARRREVSIADQFIHAA